MWPGDRPLPQLRPLILEIVAEKLGMGTGNVGQEETGNQHRAGNRQEHQREDEDDPPRLDR
jgi:hypothetical protein